MDRRTDGRTDGWLAGREKPVAEVQFYTQRHCHITYKIYDNCLSHKMETFVGVSRHIALKHIKQQPITYHYRWDHFHSISRLPDTVCKLVPLVCIPHHKCTAPFP